MKLIFLRIYNTSMIRISNNISIHTYLDKSNTVLSLLSVLLLKKDIKSNSIDTSPLHVTISNHYLVGGIFIDNMIV